MQQSSRLAIFALLELASEPERQVSVAEIGEKYRVSSHHLAKVMHTLGRAGLVRSIRGVGGGYSFSGNARRLTLLDVIALFENTSNDCKLTDPSVATPAEWVLFDVMCEIEDISQATFGAITLSTMLKQIDRRAKPQAAKADPATNSATNSATNPAPDSATNSATAPTKGPSIRQL